MRHNIYCLLAALAIAAAGSAFAQSVTKLSASKANEYGLVYSLPNTVLDITIETEYVLKEPGEFYNYANRNLNIKDAITKTERQVSLKSITIVPRGIEDPESSWLMQFKSGQNVFVMLNNENIPLAINTETAADIPTPQLPIAREAKPTPLETPAAEQAITQEMALSSSTSKRAQLAAERIFELRDNRNELIAGQAENMPPDGEALKLALENLSAQEAALTAMFAGTTKAWTQVTTLVYQPGDEDVNNEVIARLSPIDGIVSADDLSGAPITLSMEVVNRGEIPVDEKGNEKPFPKGGIAYQIPGSALITIKYNGKIAYSQEIALAQLGVPYGLDPKTFTDKKAPAYLLLNPATGAIITLAIKEQ